MLDTRQPDEKSSEPAPHKEHTELARGVINNTMRGPGLPARCEFAVSTCCVSGPKRLVLLDPRPMARDAQDRLLDEIMIDALQTLTLMRKFLR
jgi:hypothetical protein